MEVGARSRGTHFGWAAAWPAWFLFSSLCVGLGLVLAARRPTALALDRRCLGGRC
ncbi:hypothetical protein BOTBODRAFT_29427 [Botryobasidium botryosum FD-172 SS1]|uniref:Uncharacterized protein n=1 Tax=Botryobasidium botryosum (strain FD-172 SS1) TaxID=930990 RepID=A0A067N2U8_BOTB1|nr:hypothetical protein BOTBODRAFT_29427 [Botryobasidium botryosum FD-172 SS1]